MSNAATKACRPTLQLVLMSIVAFSIGFFMSYDAAIMRDADRKIMTEYSAHVIADRPMNKGYIPQLVTAPSTTLELLGNIAIQQKHIMVKLSKEYGRFSPEIFNTVNLEKLFPISARSQKRLIRRLMIKILLGRANKRDTLRDNQPIFHLVTAGDSSAAGQGNSYSDSYTSILEDTVRGVFEVAGIKFAATNRAGDVLSGMELGICMESIFGKDPDVLSWDFIPFYADESTDAYGSSGQFLDPFLFGERAGRVFPKLPFLVTLRDVANAETLENLYTLEGRGFGLGTLNEEYLREIILGLPDFDIKPEMKPPAIKKIRCGDKIEGKERCNNPSQGFWCDAIDAIECLEEKFRASPHCPADLYQTSKLDGWKLHRLKGRILGFLLAHYLRRAALELDAVEQNESQPLEILQSEEQVEEFLFLKTQTSQVDSKSAFESWNILKLQSACINSITDRSHHHLFLDPPTESFCDDFLPFQNSYFRINDDTGYIRIDPLTSQGRELKDIAHQSDFLIGFCLKKCYGKYCDADEIPTDWSKITIRVYGMSVSGIESIGGCYVLKTDNGEFHWSVKNVDESSSGLKMIRVHEGGSPILVTSTFIVF
ncbi:hypothetical protein HJC23_012782 [Cyclotella cryptica]|uniref:Uncharacterized protein n=1 Tax=Cyclotella cryptica TaxID=29204 RepID=A0ABD3Q372_9STRA